MFCCRETLIAGIQIGEIKSRSKGASPSLEVHIQLSLGCIRSTTDFLYLQSQIEPSKYPQDQNSFHNGTASSSLKGNAQIKNGFGGPEDKDPLPKRLKDVKKDRVILIDKSSALLENVGVAYVDLTIEKGKYKLYYMRIENEQRIMANSRLEMLGSSSSFSINKLTSEQPSSHKSSVEGRGKNQEDYYYDESYSYASNQDDMSCDIIYKKKKNQQQFDDSCSLDSVMLLKQIQQNNQITNSQSQSINVNSQDQTRFMQQSLNEDEASQYQSQMFSNGGHIQSMDHQPSNTISSSNFNSEGSQYSMSSSATQVVKKENDEAMIMTQQQSGSQKNSKHKRFSNNVQNVLEDMTNSQKSQQCKIPSSGAFSRGNYQSKRQGGQSSNNNRGSRKGLMGGKENKMLFMGSSNQQQKRQENNEYFEIKSHSFTNGGNNRSGQIRLRNYNAADDDELEVKYVNDIDSLVPPKFNPDTRTYFKLSIYSPSNRLYTVNEEQNSTQSDLGYTEQFSQIMNNGAAKRLSGGRKNRVQQLILKAAMGESNENKFSPEQQNGDNEWENEQCDLSESMAVPNSPTPKVAQFIQMQMNMNSQYQKSKDYSESNSNAITQAQSLKGSIIVQKPFAHSSKSSNQESLATGQTLGTFQNPSQQNENASNNNREINMFLRESFNEFQMKTDLLKSMDGGNKRIAHQNMSEDINIYASKIKGSPEGSFVCTGGTELYLGEQASQNKVHLKVSSLPATSSVSNFEQEDDSPKAFFDEQNKKVVIISMDPHEGKEVEHSIHWDEESDPKLIGKAIEQVLQKIKIKNQSKIVKVVKGKKIISNS